MIDPIITEYREACLAFLNGKGAGGDTSRQLLKRLVATEQHYAYGGGFQPFTMEDLEEAFERTHYLPAGIGQEKRPKGGTLPILHAANFLAKIVEHEKDHPPKDE